MNFDMLKDAAMKKFEKAIEKGEVDKPILIGLIKINKIKDIYTTSSCAGRIILLHDLGSKKHSYFLAKWHEKVDEEEFMNKIKEIKRKKLKGKVWLKQDPFILHISARNLEVAKKIIDVCFQVGFKHSGIISISNERVVVEVNGLDRMSVPIFDERFGFIVDEKALLKFLQIANEKLERNSIYRKRFFDLLIEKLK